MIKAPRKIKIPKIKKTPIGSNTGRAITQNQDISISLRSLRITSIIINEGKPNVTVKFFTLSSSLVFFKKINKIEV